MDAKSKEIPRVKRMRRVLPCDFDESKAHLCRRHIYWCPLESTDFSHMVSAIPQDLPGPNDAVERADSIAKSASLLYSVEVAILLRHNELPKFGGPSPFFGTSCFNIPSAARNPCRLRSLFSDLNGNLGFVVASSKTRKYFDVPRYVRASVTAALQANSDS